MPSKSQYPYPLFPAEVIGILEDKRYEQVKICPINAKSDIPDGNYIVFVYCQWAPSIVRLRPLLNSMLDFRDLKLYIVNIDDPDLNAFIINHGLINKFHGIGEIIWMRSGVLHHLMGGKFDTTLLKSFHRQIAREITF